MSDPIIDTSQIQQALLSYLQGKSTITARVTSDQIKEAEWQGTDFSYPGIRLRIMDNTLTEKPCYQNFELRATVMSEDASSLETQQIIGIITRELHGRQFTSNNLAFSMSLLRTLPPVRSERQTWRQEVHLRGIVSG